jgi:hypothetical protein
LNSWAMVRALAALAESAWVSVSVIITIAAFVATVYRLSLVIRASHEWPEATVGPASSSRTSAYDLARRAANVANAAPATTPRLAAWCMSSQVVRLLESDSSPKSPRALS